VFGRPYGVFLHAAICHSTLLILRERSGHMRSVACQRILIRFRAGIFAESEWRVLSGERLTDPPQFQHGNPPRMPTNSRASALEKARISGIAAVERPASIRWGCRILAACSNFLDRPCIAYWSTRALALVIRDALRAERLFRRGPLLAPSPLFVTGVSLNQSAPSGLILQDLFDDVGETGKRGVLDISMTSSGSAASANGLCGLYQEVGTRIASHTRPPVAGAARLSGPGLRPAPAQAHN